VAWKLKRLEPWRYNEIQFTAFHNEIEFRIDLHDCMIVFGTSFRKRVFGERLRSYNKFWNFMLKTKFRQRFMENMVWRHLLERISGNCRRNNTAFVWQPFLGMIPGEGRHQNGLNGTWNMQGQVFI
jgi:hypothetical protein